MLTLWNDPGPAYHSHAPITACAVVDASESILIARIEEFRVLDSNFAPGKLPNETVVHDEEFLFFCVRGSCRPTNALTWLSIRSLGCRLNSERVGMQAHDHVSACHEGGCWWKRDSRVSRVGLILFVSAQLCGVGGTTKSGLGRVGETVAILGV
jgi:hypothetical protein